MKTDVDLSTELEALPRLVEALIQEGYDIAIGSRLAKASKTKRCFKREIISRIYNRDRLSHSGKSGNRRLREDSSHKPISNSPDK